MGFTDGIKRILYFTRKLRSPSAKTRCRSRCFKCVSYSERTGRGASSGIRQELSQTELASGQLCTNMHSRAPVLACAIKSGGNASWSGLEYVQILTVKFSRMCSHNEMCVHKGEMREIYRFGYESLQIPRLLIAKVCWCSLSAFHIGWNEISLFSRQWSIPCDTKYLHTTRSMYIWLKNGNIAW